MISYLAQHKSILTSFIQQLGNGDKAAIVTFMSPVTGGGGYSYMEVYPASGPTDDKASLLAYLNTLPISPGAYTLVHNGIGKGMESLTSQTYDRLRGLNGVVSFTDMNSLVYGAWNESSCIGYSNTYSIPIWSIAYQYATQAPMSASLQAIATSGYFYPTTNMTAVQNAYYSVLGTLETRLQDIYTVSWSSYAGSGDELNIRVTVTYANGNTTFTEIATTTITMP
jgi:hypothetical protein